MKNQNSYKILIANLFNVPIKTCSGSLSDTEIETLTYQINNSLFRKRARNIFFERLKEQKELLPFKGYNIIDKLYAKHIDNELASVIVDKMHVFGFGFMSLDTEQIIKMARKVGYMRFIGFFDESKQSFSTFISIFNSLSDDEKTKSENVKVYVKYFSGKGFSHIESPMAEPVITIIKTVVPPEKARPQRHENGIKDSTNWDVYFGKELFNKIYLTQ